MMTRRPTFVLAVCLTGGCLGEIAPGESAADPPGPAAGARDVGGPANGPGGGPTPAPPTPAVPAAPPVAPPAACSDAPTPHARLVRLTNTQYRNTVRDLLSLDAAAVAAIELEADPSEGDFDTDADGLTISEPHLRRFAQAAEEIAGRILTDAASWSRVVPCARAAGDPACVRKLVTDLGARAFRRPLEKTEIDAFVALHGRGAALQPGAEAFASGVALVVQTMLAWPDFLYRIEKGEDPDGDGRAPLGDHEQAVRLSYALWNTMPDAALFEAAAQGRLRTPAQVKATAATMVNDARAIETLLRFHRQWLEADKLAELNRDAKAFPAFVPGLGADLRRELDLFVEDVTFKRNEGLKTLLTAPYTFANRNVARLYGATAPSATEFARIELGPGRAGVLTQAGFLAARAYFDTTDPIHRGLAVQRNVLCATIPEPPGDAMNQKLPPADATLRTTRQRVERLTAGAACVACHAVINPPGFAFERFDAVGAARTTDNGAPIDATGALALDGAMVSFDGAVDLVTKIAASSAARACYATHWMTYLHGRPARGTDRCAAAALATAMARPAFSVKDLVVELAAAPSFQQHVVRR